MKDLNLEVIMSDEQREILRMLSDSVISVEEAERLLNALKTGQREKAHTHHGSHQHYGHHRGSGFSRKAVHNAANTIQETISSIGPVIKEMVGDVASSFKGSDVPSAMPPDDHRYELIVCENGEFPIAKGETLHVINDKEHNGTLNLNLGEDDTCKIKDEEATGLRIHRSPVGPTIRWMSGTLTVTVPKGLAGINAVTYSGDMEIDSLDCWINAKVLGGDIELVKLKNGFNAKAMGGNMRIALGDNWDVSGQAKSMGGDVTVLVPESANPLEIVAAAVGGDITWETDIGCAENSSTHVKKRVRMLFGEGDKTQLAIKSVGGNIDIKKG
jgi:SHOCT-like domain